jgi:hypothetical protein
MGTLGVRTDVSAVIWSPPVASPTASVLAGVGEGAGVVAVVMGVELRGAVAGERAAELIGELAGELAAERVERTGLGAFASGCRGLSNSRGIPRLSRCSATAAWPMGVAAASWAGERLSSQRAWSSCCHCQSSRASTAAASSRATSLAPPSRGEKALARAAWPSIHQSRASERPQPTTNPLLSNGVPCRLLSRCWGSRRPRRGARTSSRDHTSAGRFQSRKAGATEPIAQQSNRSSCGRGPGSLPARSSITKRASRGITPRPRSCNQSSGSLRGDGAATLTALRC